MKFNNKIIISFLIGVAVIGIGWFVFFANQKSEPVVDTKLVDAFAKCLTQQGVVMYGAYWCPHCQRQKKLFGDSFKYINYVECTKDVNKCQEKNIEGYPTWIFKNGERIKREATFEDLAEKTSCKAP